MNEIEISDAGDDKSDKMDEDYEINESDEEIQENEVDEEEEFDLDLEATHSRNVKK